ncbi:uncharacterized protein LOC142349414 [Convolutriloba macropyga]|uniref:uncharacterized protein LOC142349414 n=1 Tax=Convolutriloba macropyga TaxID=536237 RepID=UPI003F51E2B1
MHPLATYNLKKKPFSYFNLAKVSFALIVCSIYHSACVQGSILVERRNYFPELPVKLGSDFHLGSFFDKQIDRMAALDRLAWLMKLNSGGQQSQQTSSSSPARRESPRSMPVGGGASGSSSVLRLSNFNKRPNMRLRLGTVSRRRR